ncbi:hypothetical protein [Streptomyces sp. FH025]|uniref:hypothetical protein n=1 Tax=Streptomyces sp. FH025 TaxID=2815937 RepID=UPI001A9D9527|nr:hypothetical protein [Streptomyces sp. FH025]MBO1418885.1 hypothetical protein [Streptomyces sp. FH025]
MTANGWTNDLLDRMRRTVDPLGDAAALGVPVNEEDLAGTLMSFSVLIPLGLAKRGTPVGQPHPAWAERRRRAELRVRQDGRHPAAGRQAGEPTGATGFQGGAAADQQGPTPRMAGTHRPDRLVVVTASRMRSDPAQGAVGA